MCITELCLITELRRTRQVVTSRYQATCLYFRAYAVKTASCIATALLAAKPVCQTSTLNIAQAKVRHILSVVRQQPKRSQDTCLLIYDLGYPAIH